MRNNFSFKTGKANNDDLLFVPITYAIGKVLQSELPDATKLPTEANNPDLDDVEPELVAPINPTKVAKTSDDTLDT